MRGETAEIKVSYETKLAEALQMMETAQKKFDEAEEKLLNAKSLEAEFIRTRNASLRSLQDIEDREDQLRRYRISFELEYVLNFLVELSLTFLFYLSYLSIVCLTDLVICELCSLIFCSK